MVSKLSHNNHLDCFTKFSRKPVDRFLKCQTPKMVMKSPMGKPMNPKSLGFNSIRIRKLDISNEIYQITYNI